VILSFGIEGPDTESWVVRYVASGEEEKAQSFSGHMVTVNGLTVGKEYTFTVEPESDLYLTGENTLTYIAQNVVLAENLSIDSCADGKLSASWSAPVDVLVDSWTVRYVCNDGSEESVTTDACAVTFEDIDTTLGYTVEVLAAGMSLGQRTSITANSLTITNMTAEMVGNDLQVTWESSVAVDEAGWLLQYTIDGSENKYTVSCNENSASLEDVIPGAEYSFSLETATGNQILNGVTQYTVPEAEHFVGYGGSADRMTFNMCRTPASPYWDRFDLSDSDYTTEFEIGENASFLVRLRGEYDISYDEIVILYVIYAEDGSFVTCSKDAFAWTNIWNKNYGELDIPVMPDEVGAYTMTIYFNSDFAGQVDFTITG